MILMIKPIEIGPLNTSKKLYFECEKCGSNGTITLENDLVNVDQEGKSNTPLEYECQKCGAKL